MKKTLIILFLIFFSSNIFAGIITSTCTANYFVGDGNSLTNLQPDKQKIINSIDDFPAPSGDVITLENYHYILNSPITTDKRFDLGVSANLRFSAVGALESGITYTGTGNMITCDSLLAVEFISWLFTAPNGTLFDISSFDANAYVYINQGFFASTENLGTINDAAFFMFQCTLQAISQGITLNNNSTVKINGVNNFLWNNVADCDYFKIIGTQGQLNIIDVSSVPQSNEAVFNIPLTTTLNAEASIVASPYFPAGGTLFRTGSRDQTSIDLHVSASSPVPDSTVKSEICVLDNTDDTIIEDTSIAKKVNATWIVNTTERVTADATGRITYLDNEEITVKIECYLFLKPPPGTTKLLAGYIGKTSTTKTTITYDNSTNIVQKVEHGLIDTTSIRLSNAGGGLPAELDNDNFYFVINANADDFQVSLTEGGGAVAFTDDGTGTNSYQLGELIQCSERKNSIAAASPKGIEPSTLVNIVFGDEIEVFVENETDANDITVTDANFVIFKI